MVTKDFLFLKKCWVNSSKKVTSERVNNMTKHYTYTQSQFGKYFTNVARIMRKCDLSLLLIENGEGHFHRLDKYYPCWI